jgi:hypothetical protein
MSAQIELEKLRNEGSICHDVSFRHHLLSLNRSFSYEYSDDHARKGNVGTSHAADETTRGSSRKSPQRRLSAQQGELTRKQSQLESGAAQNQLDRNQDLAKLTGRAKVIQESAHQSREASCRSARTRIMARRHLQELMGLFWKMAGTATLSR